METCECGFVQVNFCVVLQMISTEVKKMFLVFFFFFLPIYRLREMYPNWPTTQQPFIRRSFLSLVEFSRAILPEINPAVMLCTSLTQSLNSGTNPSWRGTDLCHVLGQSFQRSHTQVAQMCIFFFLTKFLIVIPNGEKPLGHVDVAEVGYIRWTEDSHLLKRSPHFRSG